jgi:hypothetical protein
MVSPGCITEPANAADIPVRRQACAAENGIAYRETEHGGRGVGRKIEPFHIQRIHRQNVAMHFSSRRTCAGKARRARIGVDFARAGGQLRGRDSGGQAGSCRGQIHNSPMPPARARRRIGIVERHDVAFCAGGRIGPAHIGRSIAARAAEAVGELGLTKLAACESRARKGEIARVCDANIQGEEAGEQDSFHFDFSPIKN